MKMMLLGVMLAGCAWGQVEVLTARRGSQTPNALVVTGAVFHAEQVTGIPHETNTTAHASLFAGKLDSASTNGWVVSAHQAWLTNGQNSVTLTNFTATGHFMVPNGMIHMFPGVGSFATAYRRFGYDNGTFLFYDYSEFPDLYLYKFLIDPRDSSITYGSGLSAERWLFPTEGSTNTVASKSWVDTQTALKLSKSGDTATGPLLTTLDHTTTAPSDKELVSAAWVRGLAMSGQEWYFTSTTTNGFGNKTANFVALSSSIPAAAFTNAIASPLASNTYLVGGITTNTYTALRSPITLDAYLARSGGTTASVIPVHPEIYYIYAGTTNHLGDWSVPDQQITETVPTRKQWVVAFPEPTITGSVQVVAYMKSGTISGPAAGLNIYGGGIYSSHIDIQNTATGSATAGITGAQVTNIVRSIIFTNQLWGAAGTNATYKMSWDITNGTFRVEEILP